MRMLQRLTMMCLCLLLATAAAWAETTFLPGMEDWALETLPLQIDVSAKVSAHQPFDDNRLTQLTAILDPMTMRLNHQAMGEETQSRVALMIGESELLAMNQQQSPQGTFLQLSSKPDTTYVASAAPLDILLEGDTQSVIPFDVDLTAYAWLEEGYALLNNLSPAMDAFVKEKAVKTTIEDMGKASVCQDYTVSKDEAPKLTEILTALCPEGRLKQLLGSLVFSGKQTLRVYRTEEGVPLRMEYNGNCGVDADHLRTVNLIWRLRRDDTAWRDEVTLKSPAVKGTDRNTVVWTCYVTKPDEDSRRLKGEIEVVTVKDKQKTSLEGSFDLKNEMDDDTHHVTGRVMIRQMLPGEDTWEKLVFEPDMLLAGTASAPLAEGSVVVTRYWGSKILEQAALNLRLQHTDYLAWSMREHTVNLALLNEEQLADVRRQVQLAMAGELAVGLLRQLGADAAYLLQDLPEETVQQLLTLVGN